MEELYGKKSSFQYELELVAPRESIRDPVVARPLEAATKSNARLHTSNPA